MTLPVSQFILQRLREFDPNRAVPRNGGWFTLLVAPLSIILQPLRNDLDRIEASQSILQILESAAPDDFAEIVVDYLLSNLRVERKTGNKATSVERVRFFTAQDFIAEASALTFRHTSGLKFVNTSAVNITESQMQSQFDGEFFFIDMPIEAETEGTDFNVGAGTISTFENEPAGVADVSNTSAITDGASRETNRQFIARAKLAISVRTLVTAPGISSRITEDFEAIREVLPTGFGDSEMMRDILSNVHVGGWIDAWMKPQTLTEGTFNLEAGLVADTTRELGFAETVTFNEIGVDGSAVPIQRPLFQEDLVSGSVVVTNNDATVLAYTEGTDYSVDLVNGAITRLPGSPAIAHVETLTSSGALLANPTTGGLLVEPLVNFHTLGVKPGDRLVFDNDLYGGTATDTENDGSYTVRTVSANSIGIFGAFASTPSYGGPNGDRGYAIYGRVKVAYRYNPVAIDIIRTARTGREDFTITNVPFLRVKEIEELDAITGEPLGTLLEFGGGYGTGGYGAGGYGTGARRDWILKVVTADERYSALDDLLIEFNQIHKGKRVRVVFEHSPDVTAVHDFVIAPANRDVAADILAKHAVPAFFGGPIFYEVEASNAATTEATMQAAIDLFLNAIGMGNGMELSDLVDEMYDNGAVKVTLPIQGNLEVHNTDGSIIRVVDEDVLAVPDTVFPDPSNRPLTKRISHLLPGDYTLTQTTAAAT